jgi:hypothetical protein
MAEDGAPLVGMTYPEVLSRQNSCFSNWNNRVETMDLRHDSLADHKGISFLDTHPEGFDLIITNPPFNIAQDIIRHALTVVQPTGFVVMLLRLNFFGGQERAKWIAENMPQRAYVHSRRMGFNAHRQDLPPKKRRATDSIEYAHFVWRQGEQPKAAQLRVI